MPDLMGWPALSPSIEYNANIGKGKGPADVYCYSWNLFGQELLQRGRRQYGGSSDRSSNNASTDADRLCCEPSFLCGCDGGMLRRASSRSSVYRQGHEIRLMSREYVRPYIKVQNNDDRDAEGIAEAASRPTMRFVELKSKEQLDIQTLHRVRSRLVAERTNRCRTEGARREKLEH